MYPPSLEAAHGGNTLWIGQGAYEKKNAMENPHFNSHLGVQFPALTYPQPPDAEPEENPDSGAGEDLPPGGDDEDWDDLRPATDAIEL